MGVLNIRARIWLSIGIFILGFLGCTLLSQFDQMAAERQLGTISDAKFPASRASHDAQDGFQRTVEAFGEAVVIGDLSGLDRARIEGRRVVESLRQVASTSGVPADESSEAGALAVAVNQYLSDAQPVYGFAAAAGGNLAPGRQRQLRDLAGRAENLKRRVERFDAHTSDVVRHELSVLRTRSARTRMITLGLFGLTFAVATILVNLTVSRAIMAPLAKVQSELAHERDLLCVLLDNIPDAIYFKDAESRFIRVNKAQAAVLGVADPRDAYGATDLDFFDHEMAREAFEDERQMVATGEPLVSKVERISRKGMTRWVSATKMPVKDEHGDVRLIVGISRDVTDWELTLDALKRSEESFRLLFATIPHAVFVCDVETLAFLEVNEAAERDYGYSDDEFRKRTLWDIVPPEERERLQKLMRRLEAEGPPTGAWKNAARDGRILDVEVASRLLAFKDRRAMLVVAQDVTDRRRLELELRHAQKLESVGQLAAGIAHEINTPIQYVGDNLRFVSDAFCDRQLVLGKYEQLARSAKAGAVPASVIDELDRTLEAADAEYLSREIPKALKQSLDGVERVAGIVRAMKSFAHPGQRERAAADLNQALEDALIVARHEIKYVADVETDFGELPAVVCHIADINQVFLNLLVNAAQAIAEARHGSGKGLIRIETRRKGDQVRISISDTGCGIPENVRSKIFEPFFTTKEVGRGTGQGLAISHNVVLQHGGRILFEPNPPQGTRFVIFLPIGPAGDLIEETSTVSCGAEES